MASSISESQWTIREQLVLASAVQQSGDKNWVSVSRAIKPLMEDARPTDYFSQKNCALQYGAMLDRVPNRRKRRASEDGTESTEQLIVRELTERRISELNKSLPEIRAEYLALMKDIELLEKGELDDRVPEFWDKLNSELAGDSSPSQKADVPIPSVPTPPPTDLQIPKEAPSPVNQPTTVSAEPPSSTPPQMVTIKKEPGSDSESPLVRLPPFTDDKVLSPMQTPVPTSSEQPLTANLHIILQERNKAVDNLLSETKNSAQLKTSPTKKSLDDTTPKTSLPATSTDSQSGSSSVTVLTTLSQTTTTTTAAALKSPIKETLNTSLPKSVPIMAYLTKNQATTSQPSSKGSSMLQSLVSAPSKSLSTTPVNPPTPVSSTFTPVAVSVPVPVTMASSHNVSPLATASVVAPSVKPASVSTFNNSQVSKPSLVTVQPVSLPISTSNIPSTNITAVTVSSPVKSAPSQDNLLKPSSTEPDTTPKEAPTMFNPKPESAKDIKSLLALPPVSTKQPLKKEESLTDQFKKDPPSTPQRPPANTPQKPPTTTTPQKSPTTPIKTESDLVDVLSDTPLTPISSPPSVLATPSSSIAMETQDQGAEDDTPTKFKKGQSILKRSLLARSRKRKHPEDDGLSVESTDTEEEGLLSQAASTVSSPAPSQCGEMDVDALRAHKQWKKGIMIVWRHAAQHKFANFFLHPVREEDAPGYKEVILCPTDLSSIKRKIESGQIRNDIEFQREMLLMFQNAFMYNSSDHEVYKIAQSMKRDVLENLQTYLATQAPLVEDSVTAKSLRGRRGDQPHEESSPAVKKRRTRMDDRD